MQSSFYNLSTKSLNGNRFQYEYSHGTGKSEFQIRISTMKQTNPTNSTKNLECNNHTTTSTSYCTYFKFYEVHFSLLSLSEDSFSQSEVLS